MQGTWFYPQSGKIPHASGQLSPCTTTTEPVHSMACEQQPEKPAQWEVLTPQIEGGPHSPQLERKAGAATKIQ